MNETNQMVSIKERNNGNGMSNARTTIGLRSATKDKLDKNRAPGQCYNGFIYQLVDLWEKTNGNRDR